MSTPLLNSLKHGQNMFRECFKYPTNINWYPHHMSKSLKVLNDKFFPITNLILEIRDARLPVSSNHDIINSYANKIPRIIIFNKADLLSKKERDKLQEWINLKKIDNINTIDYIIGNGQHPNTSRKIMKNINNLIDKNDLININNLDKLMIGIMGFPNTGKSTIINALINTKSFDKLKKTGRKGAIVGKFPGIILS